MNKIVSNFYLIKVGGKPSYVGYTNRPIKARFKEHNKDKDFGDELVTLESLGSLEYDFTWDMELINSYAKEVSDKETELILTYNTQDSIWQKGLGTTLGGQTWANVKYFIRTNRDNPKFRGLPEEAILAYLEEGARANRYMSSFVNNMNLPEDRYISDFVNTMNLPETIYMKSFVSNMNLPETIYMKHFVSNMNLPEVTYMKHFVSNMNLPEVIYMKHFVSNMNLPIVVYMQSFVNTMNLPEVIYMKSFVSNMNLPEVIYMKSFVGNMKKPIDK